MDRRHLEYFVAVAELGSFTRAAQSLSIAQPSLSHAIGWLERDLGSRLFERHGRGVRLTPAGEALLEPARRSLRSFQLARGAVRAVSEGGFGRLSIITNTLWAVDPLARLIGGFRALHPGVQLTVADPARRSDVLDAVRLGGAELGLVDGTPPRGILASLWLAEHELVAVLPTRSGVVPPSIAIGELEETGLVCTPGGTALRSIVDELLRGRRAAHGRRRRDRPPRVGGATRPGRRGRRRAPPRAGRRGGGQGLPRRPALPRRTQRGPPDLARRSTERAGAALRGLLCRRAAVRARRSGEPDVMRERWPSWVYGVGSEPDQRFSLANERTFLAWVRTALAMLAGGVALDAVDLPGSATLQQVLAVTLVLLGLGCAVVSWLRWAATERAMRLRQPLPSTTLIAALSVTLVLVAAALVFLVL